MPVNFRKLLLTNAVLLLFSVLLTNTSSYFFPPIQPLSLDEVDFNNLQIDDISRISLNRQAVNTQTDKFNFLVTGHLYGKPARLTAHPAASFTQKMEALNRMEPLFFFSLGDIVQQTSYPAFHTLNRRLLSRAEFPVLNAVGNHDVGNRALYENLFGRTYYSFSYKNGVFVVLDTEVSGQECNITSDQLSFLKSCLANALSDPDIDHVFILMHKALFLNQDVFFQASDRRFRPNDFKCYQQSNYPDLRANLLLKAAENKPVYIFAGDVGAFAGNLSPYYYQEPNTMLFEVAIGIGDSQADQILSIFVEGDEVLMEAVRLSDLSRTPISLYDRRYWIEEVERAGQD